VYARIHREPPGTREDIITDGAHESTIYTSERRQGEMANTRNQKVTRKGKGKRPAGQHDLRGGSRKIILGPSASLTGSSASMAVPISSDLDTNCSAPAKSAVCVPATLDFRARGNFDKVVTCRQCITLDANYKCVVTGRPS